MLKSLILLFVHLISLRCPVLSQARPIDSLNRTSLFIHIYNYNIMLGVSVFANFYMYGSCVGVTCVWALHGTYLTMTQIIDLVLVETIKHVYRLSVFDDSIGWMGAFL